MVKGHGQWWWWWWGGRPAGRCPAMPFFLVQTTRGLPISRPPPHPRATQAERTGRSGVEDSGTEV